MFWCSRRRLVNRVISPSPPIPLMCLAVPGKVLEVSGNIAKVDFGHGAVREVDVSLVDVKPGQYVLVHVGYAIQVIDEEEARETLRLWEEMLGGGGRGGKP